MSNKEIYLVEDSHEFRQLIRNIFTEFLPDYRIRFFQGGQELYQYMVIQSAEGFSGRRPGLIILDWALPMINGCEIVRLLRQTPLNSVTDWRTIPVIVLSGVARQEDVNECYAAGASSFFTKPVDFEELKAVFKTICHYWMDYNSPATIPVIARAASRCEA